ncbi:MAG: hypothetical protein OHK0017_06730 [Patescibacteria group bacterium]
MFLITTPIPYTNSQPHLGHLLEGIFNDTIARFYRRLNDDVILTMGLDQHGLKIYEEAIKNGQTPEEFAREQGQKFIGLWEQFNVKYDAFIHTESKEHILVSQLIWRKLAEKDFIYKKKYDGLYCIGCEDFYAPSQLTEDGLCPIHLKEPVKMSEENYFFRLSAFEETVKNFLRTADIHPDYVRKEQMNFVDSGLQDISISREKSRLPWGVAVPGDDSQVMYVWFEALINYLTGTVNLETVDRWYELPALREETEEEIWEEIRAAMPIKVLYASKEIAKFHLVIFPAMLEGCGLTLPERSLAHGLIMDAEGRKFSKSLGNGVLPAQLVEKFGIDGSRFVMLHEINIDGDTAFDWNRVTEAYNSHLADNIGNLLMRVTTLVEKFLDGQINWELDEIGSGGEVQNFAYLLDQAEDEGFERVNAAAMIFNREGKLLLAQRSETKAEGAGLWHIPGGKIEEDEDPIEALHREIKEELNLEITKVIDRIETVHDYDGHSGQKTRSMFFVCRAEGEITLNNENKAFKFVDFEEMKQLMANRGQDWVDMYSQQWNEAKEVIESEADLSGKINLFDFSEAYVKLNELNTRAALDIVLEGGKKGNEFLEQTKPWTLAKEGKMDEVKQVLTALSYLLRDLSTVLSIFLPDTADRIYYAVVTDRIKKAEVIFPKVELEK